MLINFANEGLTSRILSDRISSDEYDVTNLISLEDSARRRGFLAGHFIKPPVGIKLEFTCDINIRKVVIQARVGQQKSSGFEVSTGRLGCPEVSVASVILDPHVNLIEFNIHGKSSQKNSVSFKSSKYLNKIRNVTVRIFKTEGSTLPSLGRLEIWGEINKITPEECTVKVLDLWKTINSPKVPSVKEREVADKRAPEKRFRYTRPRVKVELPEEFLDPITWELMTIPMALPSGNIVDASTIERFCNAEKEYGRGRSDPFTGVAFSDHKKPIVASSLKARIDRFLLENDFDPEIESAPRALGKAPQEPSSSSVAGPSGTNAQKRSFEEVLKSCLSGLPSFLEKPEEKKRKNICAKCDSGQTLFKLNCDHLVCRQCLCQLKSEKDPILCPNCWEQIDFNKINRHHSSIYFV